MLKKDGSTLIEILVSIAVFASLSVLIVWVFITSLRSSDIVWDQLEAQNDGRRTVSQFVTDIRKAEVSSLGAYPIAYASSTELTFYANVDGDSLRERVRYFLEDAVIYRGVTKPTGDPLSYDAAVEATTTIARSIVNESEGVPLFEYFPDTFAGTSSPFVAPYNLTDIALVKIILEIERDPLKSPVPFHVEGIGHIRNVKDN